MANRQQSDASKWNVISITESDAWQFIGLRKAAGGWL
jgi:hypothetical protein